MVSGEPGPPLNHWINGAVLGSHPSVQGWSQKKSWFTRPDVELTARKPEWPRKVPSTSILIAEVDHTAEVQQSLVEWRFVLVRKLGSRGRASDLRTDLQ